MRASLDTNAINNASNLNWSLKSQVVKFVRKFWKSSYRDEDNGWVQMLMDEKGIKIRDKFMTLNGIIK